MIMTNNYYDALAQLRDEEMKEEVMNRMAEEAMKEECLAEERWEHREYMTYAEYPLNGQETYIRVECVDKNGKTAWTNALFL